MKQLIAWLVSVGDAQSQFYGRLIPVQIEGKWTTYTRNANESISGASSWHAENGRWPWVETVINLLFRPFGKDHCLNSRISDREKAYELLSTPLPREIS